MNRWALAATLAVACTKGQAPPGSHAWLVVNAAQGSDVDVAAARVGGRGILGVTITGSRLVVEIDPHSAKGRVAVEADGACPITVQSTAFREGTTTEQTLEPLLDFGAPAAQVGFDAKFEITARPRCPEASGLRLVWRVAGGAPLREVAASPDGLTFSARTEPLGDALGRTPPWGVVPIAPRTRGTTEIEVSWTSAAGSASKRILHVSAAARAHGLPNVTVGTRLYLGGDGFRVVAAPSGAKAAIDLSSGRAALTPDAPGKWTLADAQGRLLRLAAGAYDTTPLDCGRSECHAVVSDVARTSPMATIFERGLDSKFAGDYPACALECHTVGEPGADDGGFASVLAGLGRTASDLRRTGFHDLPAALRRLSGVGCLGCHGPGAIPEESARYSILSVDVCATCHDAPPRYGHVAAWRTTRMARADADPKAASDAECVRCHTTWGFLGRPERRPAQRTEPLGIGCAACHSVHPDSPELATSAGTTCADTLLRIAPVPALLNAALDPRASRSNICLGCHTPAPGDRSPAGTAAAIWSGRGGLDPKSGGALDGAAPHAAVPGGCIGCHRAGPPELDRGAGHAFRGAPSACASCHAQKATEPAILLRAEALWKSLGGDTTSPPHASRRPLDLTTTRGRAAWDVALVLEDPAADTHNAPYARRLLDAAEAALAFDRNVPAAKGAP